MKTSSIFNEVLGPVMVGPSSSHTAGPARIGKIINGMLEDTIRSIDISFDREGSFAATYRGQGSDYGFVGGLLGYDAGDEKIKTSLDKAIELNIDIKFIITDFEKAVHPNHVKICIKYINGGELRVEAVSTGGGMCEVIKYQGFDISIKGDSDILVIECSDKYTYSNLVHCFDEYEPNERVFDVDEGKVLAFLEFDKRVKEETLDYIRNHEGISKFKFIECILPIMKLRNPQLPFKNATEALNFATENSMSLWEIACEYEQSISGEDRETIVGKMVDLVEIMRGSALEGCKSVLPQRGFLPPKAKIMAENFSNPNSKKIDMGLLNKVMIWATATMEYDICKGRIVAAPTGGSCGVLPACIVGIGDDLGIDNEGIAKAMLSAGLIGVFIDYGATFAAEICGCQAENGSASAMGAAGIVSMLNGSAEEGFAAASLALQNLMGLICDPVASVGNVPCVSRNPMAAFNSVLAANMVLNGFNPLIPLDETIYAMMKTGEIMPMEHRCTGLGGLCITETAKKIVY